MKRLWISIFLILAVVAMTFVGSYHFREINQNVSTLITNAELAALSADWDEVKRLSEEAYQSWDDHSFFLYSTMRHLDTDAIYTALVQAVGCAQTKDEHGFVAAARTITTKLWLMEETDGLSLENIL